MKTIRMETMRPTLRGAFMGLCLAAAAASPAQAERVIRLIVPYGPGATLDTVARNFNADLGKALGATVIVENRAGAGGTMGTAFVARSTDHNTLLFTAASHNLAPTCTAAPATTRPGISPAWPTSAMRDS